jgi:2-haloalkanoic acid dehalogenase type II
MVIKLVVFDVNETLSDMSPLRERFGQVGAPETLFATWFAGVLRDGFALTAAGGYAEFRDVAAVGLRGLLGALDGWTSDLDVAVEHILAGVAGPNVHADVPDGTRRLHAAGLRLATLTNGSAALTETLLTRAGLRELFTALRAESLEAGTGRIPLCHRTFGYRSDRNAARGGSPLGYRRCPPGRTSSRMAAARCRDVPGGHDAADLRHRSYSRVG